MLFSVAVEQDPLVKPVYGEKIVADTSNRSRSLIEAINSLPGKDTALSVCELFGG